MGPKGKTTKAAKAADPEVAGATKKKVKRAPSPYILFCTEKRPEIKISHPDATFGETGKILGQMWAALDEKSKAVYAKESAAKKEALEVEQAEL